MKPAGPAPIDCIVFDIGKVLVDFSYDPFAGFLVSHGAVIQTREEFIAKTDLLLYETGALTTAQFLANVSSLLPQPPDPALLAEKWQRIFEPIPEMLTILKALKGRYRLLLMSNTNELHWAHLQTQYALTDYVDGAVISYQVGKLKPDPAIFNHAVSSFNLTPASTLLIDDVAEHILTAHRLGWNTIHHTTPQTTLTTLTTLGITQNPECTQCPVPPLSSKSTP